jgi:hypothetical protein
MRESDVLVSDAQQVDAAKNQSLCRDANEQILEGQNGRDDSQLEFICECADLSCDRRMSLDLEEYEAVRRFPTRFIVVAGHADRWVERVVVERPEYRVVEKFGPGGIAAIKLDRRLRAQDAAVSF